MHKTVLALAFALFASSLSAAEIGWQTDLQAAHAAAQAQNKLLLIHFYSDHCVYCDRLEQGAFQSGEVIDAIQTHFVPVKIHGIKNADLSQYFKIKGFPMDVVVDPAGNIFSHSISPQQPNQYVDMLLTAMNRHRMQQQAGEQIAAAPTAEQYAPNQQQNPGMDASLAAPGVQSPPMGFDPAATPPATSAGGPSQYASYPIGGEAAAMSGAVAGQAPLASPENADFALPEDLVNEAVAEYHAAPISQPNRDEATAPHAAGSHASQGPDLGTPDTFGAPDPAASGGFETPASELRFADDAAAAANAAPEAGRGAGAAGRNTPRDEPTFDAAEQLALDGHCPVSVMAKNEWVLGDKRYGAHHMGRLYLFADAEAQQAFMETPDRFAPMLAGNDVVALTKRGQVVRGTREWGLVHHGRMYLFSGEETFNEFFASPEKFSTRAEEIMRQASAPSGSLVR